MKSRPWLYITVLIVILLGVGNTAYRIFSAIESENLAVITIALCGWGVVMWLLIRLVTKKK